MSERQIAKRLAWVKAQQAAARKAKREAKASYKPAYGSQEWAETYRDDLGESPDY
jgi:hypothetical protein